MNETTKERIDVAIEKIGKYSGFPLQPHQISGIHWMFDRGGCSGGIVADEMGLGKTYMVASYIIISCFLEKLAAVAAVAALKKTLVVVPKSLFIQWKNEFKERFNINVTEFTSTLDTPTYFGFITLTTYGILVRSHKLIRETWERVIFDEGHCLRNPKTQVCERAFKLQATEKWIMTGTPFVNTVLDVHTLLSIIQNIQNSNIQKIGKKTKKLQKFTPSIMADYKQNSISRKLADYITLPEKNIRITMVNPREETQLHRGLMRNMRKRARPAAAAAATATPQIPRGMAPAPAPAPAGVDVEHEEYVETNYIAKTFRSVSILKTMVLAQIGVIMPRMLENKYKQVEDEPVTATANDIEKETEIHNNIKKSFHTQYKLYCIAYDLLNSKDNGKKKIVFTKYRQESAYFREILTSNRDGINKYSADQVAIIDGKTTAKERMRILKNPPDVLILNIICGACGLNLTVYTDVYYSCNTWNPMEQNQSEARVYRIGQLEIVTIHRYILKESFDEYMNETREIKNALSF